MWVISFCHVSLCGCLRVSMKYTLGWQLCYFLLVLNRLFKYLWIISGCELGNMSPILCALNSTVKASTRTFCLIKIISINLSIKNISINLWTKNLNYSLDIIMELVITNDVFVRPPKDINDSYRGRITNMHAPLNAVFRWWFSMEEKYFPR